jgi:macrolide transport system ATP-binding/permease protein
VRDLRYALRSLWRQRAFTITAVVTLAVGLGANTALFGFINAALRPLAVPGGDRIVSIAGETKGDQSGGFQYGFSLELLKDLQTRSTSFTDVFGGTYRIGGLASEGKPLSIFFLAVSDNYFSSLRLTPHVGQLFTRASGSPVSVVLGHGLWTKHFRADPGVIGKPIRINGNPAVIQGVVPKQFTGTLLGIDIDLYLPVEDLGDVDSGVNTWLYRNRAAKPMQIYGRLKPDATVGSAHVEVNSILSALGQEFPATDAGVGARVVPEPLARPLPLRAISDVIPLIQLFTLAIAALVLLLACLNVANLMLVRATIRERELAVRAALGATRAQLVRQMVTEGLVLSALGGVAGLIVGQWVSAGFVSRIDIGADLPFAFDVTFDWRVFLYSLAAVVVTGIGLGLWPAWRASRADARAALHDGGKGTSDGVDRQRLRRLLVVGQIAGSLALLIVAGLFIRSLVSAQQIDLGFDSAHLLTVRLDPSQIDYDEARTNEFHRDLIRRVSAWPEVASVSQAFSVPMTYLIGGGAFFVEGRAEPPNSQPPVAFLNHIGHGYFDTMQIPIVRGRPFREEEERLYSGARRVAIVNETMAQMYWPGQNPIGKRFRVYNRNAPLMEIVGVARDSKYVLVFEPPRPFVYLPVELDSSMRTIHVRAKGDPAALAPRLEREIAAMAPDLPLMDLRTMEQSLRGIFGYFIFRLGAVQAGGMGFIGLTLALVGVYGVVSFGASLRTREIGIRMALGASPRDVLRLILGQGLVLVLVGLVIGIGAAAAMSRALTRMLPLVNASDWGTFGSIAAGLGLLALAACYLPARRATKVPPMTALRHE